jgi:sugar lactone lactonase YvrE
MIRTLTAAAALVLALAAGVASAAPSYPATIQLDPGLQPEGISVSGNTFYVGSIPTGSIYRGNLRTGAGDVYIARTGRAAIGLELDNRGRLFVAGGNTGHAYVYNARTKADIAHFALAPTPAFINDVVVTRTGAYFTDSTRRALFRVPIGRNGRLGTTQTLPLTGDFQLQPGFNANGIDATPSGRWLVIAQSNTGKLFRVDARTGVTKEIVLANDQTIASADGILLDGRTLYAVERTPAREFHVVVVAVNPTLTAGRVVRRIADARFDVPTTLDELGRRLYVVNARFGTASPSTAAYQVLQLRKPAGR